MHARRLAVIAIRLVAGVSLHAQAFRGLGFLDPNAASPYSMAFEISGDGTTVVGNSDHAAFRWTSTSPSSLQHLGFLPGGTTSSAGGVSFDGSVVVGSASATEGDIAFRWTSGTGMVSLGTPPPGVLALHPRACSADSSVVVGLAFGSGSGSFRWTAESGFVELQTLPVPGKSAVAEAVSDDGLVAVGRSGCCDANFGAVEAVRWAGGGLIPEGLGDLQATIAPWSASGGISAGGQVVVGGGTIAPDFAAFRWENGTIVQLSAPIPPLASPSCAWDVSADGSVVVGAASGGDPDYGAPAPINTVPAGRAFMWTAADGMRDLKTVLAQLGLPVDDWSLEVATGISDDGNIITGNGRRKGGRTEAWVAALSGTPFPNEPETPPGRFAHWLAGLAFGLSEHHGFLRDPSTGLIPILPDPPPFLLGAAAVGGARWVEGAVAPQSSDQLWGVLSVARSGEADLRLLRHDGRGWSADWISGAPGSLAGSRIFGIAYEDHSGDALAVYESGAGTPRYRTYRRGIWSDERALPREAAPREVARADEGLVRWVELVGRPGTDRIELVYADERGHLLAWRWNGSAWEPESAALLATDARAFDAEVEALSGALVVAWAQRDGVGFRWARRGEDGWSRVAIEPAFGTRVEFIDLAAEPSSDRIAGLFGGRGHRALSVWDGGRWETTSRGERRSSRATGETPAALPGAVGWVGTTRSALAVWGGALDGSLAWARWTGGDGWSVEQDLRVPGMGRARSMRLKGSWSGSPLVLVSDREASLHAIGWDGRGWDVIADAPLVTRLASADALPFGLVLSRDVALLVGDPDAGACARLEREGSVDLLSFSLVPRGDRTRVDAISFVLEDAAGIERADFAEVWIESEGGLVARGEATPFGTLYFSQPIEIDAPARHTLRARLSAPDPAARVTVSLDAVDVIHPRASGAGRAQTSLAVRQWTRCE
ncbi:MAG: hypothetical protein ACRD2J_07520 [Thermoanaerobaculia bacterium]